MWMIFTLVPTDNIIAILQGGMYVFQLFDYYSGSRIILLIAFFECVAVAYIYGMFSWLLYQRYMHVCVTWFTKIIMCAGVRRFYDNMENMLGFRLNPFMQISWTVTTPLFSIVSANGTSFLSLI